MYLDEDYTKLFSQVTKYSKDIMEVGERSKTNEKKFLPNR